MGLSTCRLHPSAGPFVRTCSGCAQDCHDAQYGKTPPPATVAAPRDLRTATVADIVKRLTGDLYDKTAIDALGWGMGPAQYGIDNAVTEAEAAGLVVVTTERGKRFVHLAPKPEPTAVPVTAQERQARHALTALARTTPGRRRLIATCAEDYLSQVERRRLPVGHDRPIADDRANRADAYRMRRGDVLARLLGLAVHCSDGNLPGAARAVLAAVNTPVDRLVRDAKATGAPGLVALLHCLNATATSEVA